ncbi:4'-phosphopantetheinyl transferase family protein [Serratia marcescens]|uniref:4'-phosphopantetheinyl transferase family protein n=1 Tax=Serratia marcescens TaxID=615 RepID=UPI003D1850C2
MTSCTDIWFSRIKETDEVSILALLREEDRKRYEKIIPPKRKRNFAFRRAVLNFVLQRYVKSYSIKKNENGKPYIISHNDNGKIYFSSSSSAGLCVVSVSTDEIGVDLEVRKQSVDLIGVCEKYLPAFSDISEAWKENRIIKQLAMCSWCRMESFVKLNGLTLHKMLFDQKIGGQNNQSEKACSDIVISGNDFVCVISQFEPIELNNIYHFGFEKIHHE